MRAATDRTADARTVNGTIILTGSVDSAGDAQKVVDIANGFVESTGESKGKVINSLSIRGRDQVMLKVTIAEVQRQIIKQLGITNVTAGGGWGTLFLDHPLSLNAVSPSASNLQLMRSGSNPLSATLRAFERYGVSRILAEPTVTAISGEMAKFIAGGELPVPSSQSCTPQGGCIIGVSFKPYGVSLNFTPVVVSEGRILLRVATEVTEIDPTTVVAFQTANIPAMRTRKNETERRTPFRRLDRYGGPDSEQVAPDDQRPARSDESTDLGQSVPLTATISAKRPSC